MISSSTVCGQDSCADYNITQGATLVPVCEDFCSPDSFETFDFAAPNEDATNIIDRTTVCRCTSGANVTFECLDVEPSVWDTNVEAKDCEEYNITSGTSCKDFCSDIDPVAFMYDGSGDNINCYCASASIKICGKSAAPSLSVGLPILFGSVLFSALMLT